MNQLTPRELCTIEEGFLRPFWSPDSRFVGFFDEQRLWKIAIDGSGKPVPVANQPEGRTGGSAWLTDGRIVSPARRSARSAGLIEVSSQGGEFQDMPELELTEDFVADVSPLPKPSSFLFCQSSRARASVCIFDGSDVKELLKVEEGTITTVAHSPTGHVLFTRMFGNSGVWAFPFSLETLERTGEPFRVADAGTVSVSEDGTLLIGQAPERIADRTRSTSREMFRRRQLVWLDRTGMLQESVGQTQTNMSQPALSPDEKSVAVQAEVTRDEDDDEEPAGRGPRRRPATTDIWVHDLTRGTVVRITSSREAEERPVWHPRGKQLFFTRIVEEGELDTQQILLQNADGTGEEKLLGTGTATSVSPDGKFLVFEATSEEGMDVGYLPLEDGGEPVMLLATPANERDAHLSPEGEYLLYASDETEDYEIYLVKFPSGEGRTPVSVGGGSRARWSKQGDELTYFKDQTLMVVTVGKSEDGELKLGVPEPLFDDADSSNDTKEATSQSTAIIRP